MVSSPIDAAPRPITAGWAWALTIGLGMLFAFGVRQVWRLDGRWFYIVIIGIVLVCVSLLFIRRFGDFLLVAVLFSIPVGSFTKWFGLAAHPALVANAVPYSGGLGLGITEFLLAGLYGTWFLRVFATRSEPYPQINAIDVCVLFVVAAYLLSIPGTFSPTLGVFAVYYLIVHAAAYAYIARHLEARHLRWLFLSMLLAIAMECAIGFVQYRYGILAGLALDKGKGGADLDFQYEVPGLEDTTRATGTLYDSHALGTYASMLGMYMFSLFFSPAVSGLMRLVIGPAFLAAMVAVLLSYSRSAWLSCTVGLAVLVWISLFRWREKKMIPAFFVFAILMIPALPWLVDIVYDRFANAPGKIMSVRSEGYGIALDIWQAHPWFGYGVGNYMYALEQFNKGFAEELPVHNAILWIMAESGLVGLLAFGALVFVVMRRLWRFATTAPDPLRRLGAAAFASMVVYVTDAMTNPLYRDLVLYKMFWLHAALAIAWPRLRREGDAARVTGGTP